MAYERPLCSHEIADKFIENDCESRTLCGCIFPAHASHLLPFCLQFSLSVSHSVCLFPLLSLARSVCSCSAWLHVSLMQYARIFAQKYWWFGKCALKRQNPLSCSHQDGRLTARHPGSLAAVTCWHLPVTSCQALNILAHEFSQSLRHNSAKHEKRISKTELQ